MAAKLREVTRKLREAESALAREQESRELLVDGHKRALQVQFEELERKYNTQYDELQELHRTNWMWCKCLSTAEGQVVSLSQRGKH